MNLTMITIFTILSRRVSPCAERLYAVAVHPSGLMWPFVPACAAGRYLDLGVDGRLDRGDAVCNGNVYSQSVYDFLKLLTASERHSKRSRVAGGGMEERASRVDRPRAGPYGRQSKFSLHWSSIFLRFRLPQGGERVSSSSLKSGCETWSDGKQQHEEKLVPRVASSLDSWRTFLGILLDLADLSCDYLP